MSKHKKYVPKHRHAPEPTLRDAPKKALRTGVVMTSVAVAVTGIAVSGGVVGAQSQVAGTAQDVGSTLTDAQADTDAAAIDRSVTSRSADRRREADPVKVSKLSATSGPATTGSVDVSDGDPRDIARALMGQFGFGADQFGCLDSLWTRESGWNPSADNPSSSAYGIPQALPGSKMASAGADWATNPATQIMWGLGYIQDRYGSPCGAWAHSESAGFY
ncbi:hypothetical protein GCM10023350_45990 [Nocardioides endophyticus]|uniref:Lytic transglycosylase domain-containing protein n=1 Tax=Nocardioides endophyticus TaxID=1353775 RepID=A0ABP8ZGR6_9ACTN